MNMQEDEKIKILKWKASHAEFPWVVYCRHNLCRTRGEMVYATPRGMTAVNSAIGHRNRETALAAAVAHARYAHKVEI